jgi:predicted nucleotidyltransferase
MSDPATAQRTLERLGTPPEVVRALEQLREELGVAAGGNLKGLIVYGSVARGGYRPGSSDVNVVVLLADTTCASLAAIARPLHAAWRSAAIEPFLLTAAEVPRVADVFPIKILDIQAHHVVLCGEDPFGHLEVDREHIRLRTEQELRNLGLRLRRRFLSIVDDPIALAAMLAGAAAPLAANLEAMLRLCGHEVPRTGDSSATLEAAARTFDLDGDTLTRLADLRAGTGLSADLPDLLDRVLATIDRATGQVDTMETS